MKEGTNRLSPRDFHLRPIKRTLGAIKRRLQSIYGSAAPQKKRQRKNRTTRASQFPTDIGPARLLSVAPPVFLSGIPYSQYLGIAEAYAHCHGNSKAGFVIFPTWSLERRTIPEAIKQAFTGHRERYPNHRIQFICNTIEETGLLTELGLPAVFLNKNFMVSDRIFRPRPEVKVEFDAIYNARFAPEKRHELASAIPSVGYVTYIDREARWSEQFLQLSRSTLDRNPNHVVLNELADGLPVEMAHDQVNSALARGAVGLVLSEVEGSSYASMEYLLAGLPVVSTPSRGGRDVYFDPEYCIVCEPDPAAIRDAVADLRAREIPRDLIRARTLAKIGPERERFLALVDDLIQSLGGERRFGHGHWPFGDVSGVTWRKFEEHLAEFAERRRGALGAELGLGPDGLANVQLDAEELRPIVEAIRARPGCRLLVFGCGNDSPFWEIVNSAGTTAFLEDNPHWAAEAGGALTSAVIHAVQYGRRRDRRGRPEGGRLGRGCRHARQVGSGQRLPGGDAAGQPRRRLPMDRAEDREVAVLCGFGRNQKA